MSPHHRVPVALLCLGFLASAAWLSTSLADQGTGSPASHAPKKPSVYWGSVPDTGQFLPDTAVLARVGDHIIRAGDFIDTYYSSFAGFRPRPDSLGRVQFLQSLIDKEVMASVARKAGKAASFEDRVTMRQHTERVLSNVLFQRAVSDSVPAPSEEDLVHAQRQMGRELHLQQIVCAQRDIADQAHAELAGRKISWTAAVKRYSIVPPDSLPEGDRGWARTADLEPRTALVVFDVAVGEISPVIVETVGYSIYRVVEKRQLPEPPLNGFRGVIGDQLRAIRVAERGEQLLATMRIKAGLTHNTANMVWTAARFGHPYRVVTEGRPTLEIDTAVPSFAPEDTSRVLATYDGGRVTLGALVAVYADKAPLARPSLTTLEAVSHQVDIIALEPRLAELARERGLEKDPLTVALIEKRREEMMVEHMYEDSIMSRVYVSPAERRRYYDQHIASFTTFPTVHFAAFQADRRGEADSLAARLRKGESAAAILRADSVAGIQRGSIQQRREDEQGQPYHKLIFEELKPKQVAVVPNGKDFIVIQSLAFDAGRQLGYQEAQAYADESAQNMKAEELLHRFLARHRRATRIEARPELVMLIRLAPRS